MGRKFPFDIAMKMGGIAENPSIFNRNNPYGYRINVNHPSIRPLFEAYYKRIGVPFSIPLTHRQRMRFEEAVIELIEKM